MARKLARLACVLALVLLSGGLAFAQSTSTTSSLSGIVVDSGGGVIPGASVAVKNNATGVTSTHVTNSSGAFSVPALDIGTYTVTVSLTGFKTFVISNVAVVVGSPAAVRAVLEVGALTETVEVRGGSDLVQTQSTAVSSTISALQIQNLPLTSRNALFGFVIMLPGVDTTGSPRDSTLFGLPEQSINITIDGVNSQNNFQRESDGFYSMVFPQLDAVEQVTVTGAAAGADSAGGGSVAIRFVTRSGTNRYAGTGYYYLRHPAFNTNYYFNEIGGLGKNQLKLNQFGGSVGGPIKIPGWFDGSGKAFFFHNYEEFRQPTSATRTRTMLAPSAESGVFRYSAAGGVQQVNLLALAQQNGHTATFDPTIQALIRQIRASADGTVPTGVGVISDLTVNTQQLLYQAPGDYINHLPTSKLDFNLSQRHRLSGSYWWQEINRFPDIQNNGEATFPGLPNVASYTSVRSVGSVTLRSTFSSNLVNELLGGWQWSPGTFNSGVVASMFENQGMYSIGFAGGPNNTDFSNLTGPTRSTNPNTRHQDNWNINDTVSWLKGNHSFSFGGGYNTVGQWNDSQNVVPTISVGVQSGLDPADGMFNTTNFPGASNNQLSMARHLYALLTGRVTQVGGTANLDNSRRYVYLGRADQMARMDEYNAFAQDSWRIRPTFTLNYGVAYVVQMPLKSGNDVFSTTDYAGFCGPYGIGADGRCKLFQVGGEQTGAVTQFVKYAKSTRGYKTDWNNVAPNVGIAWRPNVQSGIFRTILGDPDTATFRAGFSTTFDKPSMGDFFGVYSGNPGRSYNANRNNTNAAHLLVLPGETWPALYRDRSRLGPPSGIPETPVYPISAVAGNDISIFDPEIQVPYTRSVSFGFQRSLNRDMAIEIRYVGTRGKKAWVNQGWNETNLIENGFFDEFKLAMANLKAHVAAGCTGTGANACSFAYRGPGTGTSPLPIYLAYLQGLPSSQAGNPASYAATNFTNTTFLGRLNPRSPNPIDSAEDDLQTTARIANALAAGLPSNFFRMNPAIGTGDADFLTAEGQSKYDSVVIDLRRRLSRGLFLNASYTRAWRWGQTRDSLHTDRIFVRSTNEVPWAVKMTANYEVPIGRGKRYGSDANPWVNGIVGDWSLNLVGRVQSGRVGSLGSVRLVGMTVDELQDMFKIRITDIVDANGRPTKMVRLLPDDVILNTRRAFSTSATSPTGYGSLGPPEGKYIAPASGPDCLQLYPGDCAPRNTYLIGPVFTRFDLSAKKKFPLGGKRTFDFEVSVLNLFDAINFTPVFAAGSGENIFRVTSAYTDISQSYDPGGRLMQVVWRVNW
jgi:hypothetical protein